MRNVKRLATAIVVVLALLSVLPASAQDFEWIYRADNFLRKPQSIPKFDVDPVRGRVFMCSGSYDTYWTDDKGETWHPVFDTLMWYLDDNAMFRFMDDGAYLFTASLYSPKNPMSILSEDGGDTWGWARKTLDGTPFTTQEMAYMVPVQPAYQVYSHAHNAVDSVNGYYVTKDRGRTYRHIYQSGYSVGNVRSPGDSLLAWYDMNDHSTKTWSILNADRDAVYTPTAVPIEVRLNGSTVRVQDWYRLKDGTDVAVYPLVGLGSITPKNSQGAVCVVWPGGSDTTCYRSYHDPLDGAERDLRSFAAFRCSDSLVLVIGVRGEVFAIRAGQREMVPVHIPAIRDSVFQGISDMGMNGHMVLCALAVPRFESAARHRFLLIDTRTLTVTETVGDGPAYRFREFRPKALMPLDERRWLWAMPDAYGEVMRTDDAGATWRPLSIPKRGVFYPPTYYGIRQLIPTPDGGVALRTSTGRWFTPDGSGSYKVALGSPNSHTSAITTEYGEGIMLATTPDLEYRARYGDPFITPDPSGAMVTCGDAVLRWSQDGTFRDTLLPRAASVVRFLDNGVWAAGKDSLWFSFNQGKEWLYVNHTFPFVTDTLRDRIDTVRAGIGDVVAADDGSILVGLRGVRRLDGSTPVDSIPGGVLWTTDLGATWTPVTEGIPTNAYVMSLHRLKTGTLLCVAAELLGTGADIYEPRAVPFVISRTVVYRSTDHGRSWMTVHNFGSSGAIPSSDPRVAVGETTTFALHPYYGLYGTWNDGRTWGLVDVTNMGQQVINDAWQSPDGWTHIATDSGYARIRTDRLTSVREAVSGSADVATVRVRPEAGTYTIDAMAEPVTFTIHDVQGREVFRVERPQLGVAPLPSLPSGAWIATVRTPSGVVHCPFTTLR